MSFTSGEYNDLDIDVRAWCRESGTMKVRPNGRLLLSLHEPPLPITLSS